MDFQKNNLISEKFRTLGNNLFQNNDYFLALIAYNKALCYAISKKSLAFAYANRSAVYLEAELYDECLQNIQLAKNSDYPKDKIQKLNDREEKCKKLLQENASKLSNIPDKFFQLSYPQNAKLRYGFDESKTQFADCMEERDGKYYATRDLKSGEIICIGETAFKFLTQPGYVNRCYSCFKVNSMNLIPSLKNAGEMFCSFGCRDNPQEKDDTEIALAEYCGQIQAKNLSNMGLTRDPCPFFDQNDSCFGKSAQNPFSGYGRGLHNVSYFSYDGIKHIYFVAKPIQPGEKLSCKIWNTYASKYMFGDLLKKIESGGLACLCFHCKLKVPANDPSFAQKWPAELLTATELVEKLAENWKRIKKICNNVAMEKDSDSDDSSDEEEDDELKTLQKANEELMELLALKKTYLPNGRYCICRTCAMNAVKI